MNLLHEMKHISKELKHPCNDKIEPAVTGNCPSGTNEKLKDHHEEIKSARRGELMILRIMLNFSTISKVFVW